LQIFSANIFLKSKHRSQINETLHPFDVSFAYFTRLEKGAIPEIADRDRKDELMPNFLLAGYIGRNPIQVHPEARGLEPILRSRVTTPAL
jgi:hypothetical protein